MLTARVKRDAFRAIDVSPNDRAILTCEKALAPSGLVTALAGSAGELTSARYPRVRGQTSAHVGIIVESLAIAREAGPASVPKECHLGSISSSQFTHDMLDMHLDRVLRHTQLHGNYLIGHSRQEF